MYSFEQLVILGAVVKLNYCIVLQEGKILVYRMYFTTNKREFDVILLKNQQLFCVNKFIFQRWFFLCEIVSNKCRKHIVEIVYLRPISGVFNLKYVF